MDITALRDELLAKYAADAAKGVTSARAQEIADELNAPPSKMRRKSRKQKRRQKRRWLSLHISTPPAGSP